MTVPVKVWLVVAPLAIGCGDRDGIDAAIDLAGIAIDRAADDAGGGINRQPGRQASRAEGQRVAVEIAEKRRGIGRIECAINADLIRGSAAKSGASLTGADIDGQRRGRNAAIAVAEMV